MTLSLRALLLLSLTLPLGSLTQASELASLLSPRIAERYSTVTERTQALEAATDMQSKVELAKLLVNGRPTSETNPLIKPDLQRALALLDDVIANSEPLRQQALGIKAGILAQSDLAEDIAASTAIRVDLAASGHWPTIARFITSGVGLPAGVTAANAEAALGAGVLAGDYEATQAMSSLLATSDPKRSTALAKQALIILNAKASNNVSAANELGRRYLFGDGVEQSVENALAILRPSATAGGNQPINLLKNALDQGVPGLTPDQIRPLIVDALGGGSTKAAEIIVNDAMGKPVYGFDGDDALFAISLMSEVGDRSALLLSAKAYSKGIGRAPDLAKAEEVLAQLADVKGLDPGAILDLGEELESLDLPIAMRLRYVEPIYRSVTGADADEANYRADRLLAAAAQEKVLPLELSLPNKTNAIIQRLREAGSRNHARSLILLGDLYYGGIWVPVNQRQAVQYYERSIAIEPSLVATERLGKALAGARSDPFEEARFREVVAQLVASGSQWGLYQNALIAMEDKTNDQAVAEAEASLLDLASKGYAPAIRNLLTRLEDVDGNDVRVDDAVAAFSKSWSIRKDFRIGQLLGEFYMLAGRTANAQQVFSDPIYDHDPTALLNLAKMEAAATAPNMQAILDYARRGLASPTTDQAQKLEFARLLGPLGLDDARETGEAALFELANAGNTDAIRDIVPGYIPKITTDADAFASMEKWSDSLAISGEQAPLIELATQYLSPNGDPETAKRVLPLVERALNKLPADTYLAVVVADAYLRGYGTPVDIQHANALIERSAAAGNKDGLAELGMQYFYGMGRERDPDTALALLNSAATLGSNVARVEIGRLHSSSNGPSVDMLKAYSMFLEAARGGSTTGMLEVGRLYLAGWGIAQNEERGVDWLEQAAELGSTDAMYQLYFHYLSKPDSDQQQTAMYWLKRSSDAGVNPARLRLAERMIVQDRAGNFNAAIDLLDEAYESGFNLAGRYRQSLRANGALDEAGWED